MVLAVQYLALRVMMIDTFLLLSDLFVNRGGVKCQRQLP